MSDDLLAPGTELGSYRIERLLGRGGMGAVFLAYDTALHRQVALKVLTEPADGETSRTRLLREARNAAGLNHPNICTIYEVGEADGFAFIAMEYVDGRSLRDRLDAGALPVGQAVRYAAQAAEALAYAHEHGVVHRDFKAANAIVTDAGRLKIVDFGLARRRDAAMSAATTATSLAPVGTVAGTPYAMAPEQVRGEAADGRADIWALGVLLHEMVAGAKPFDTATIPELYSAILRDEPRALPDGVPVEVRALVARCLEKPADRRYRDAGQVRAALDAIETGAVSLGTSWRFRLKQRPWLASVAALLAVGAALVGFNIGGVRQRVVGGPAEAAPIKLAVLPFANLTGDPSQEYFSDGLSEEMIAQLGRLHPQGLRVIARASAMRYKKADKPIDQIGRELGVDYVLDGSARREAGQVRITAKLIRTRDQTLLWTDTYQRELASILALQSDIARQVARSLALTLLPAEQTQLASVRTVNPEAYEAYLKGLGHWYKLTQADLDTALQYFEVAREKDPTYAVAYTGIAAVWGGRAQMGFASPRETTPRALAAALKAVELDSTRVEPHLWLGIVRAWYEYDWVNADQEFRRAIELNPSYPDARAFYSNFLANMNHPQQALAEIERALELDPFNAFFHAQYGLNLMYVSRFDEAITQYRSALKTAPDLPFALSGLFTAFHHKRMYSEAVDALRNYATAMSYREVEDVLAQTAPNDDYRHTMQRAAEALVARARATYVTPYDVATFYAFAGDRDRAIEWLEKGYELREPNMPFVGLPDFETLRDDVRFQDLLRRMKLPI